MLIDACVSLTTSSALVVVEVSVAGLPATSDTVTDTEMLPSFSDVSVLAEWLACQRNDMQPVAEALFPEVGNLGREMSAQRGCLLARMSGSGSAVFGLFADETPARRAAEALARPGRWVHAAAMLTDRDQLSRNALLK